MGRKAQNPFVQAFYTALDKGTFERYRAAVMFEHAHDYLDWTRRFEPQQFGEDAQAFRALRALYNTLDTVIAFRGARYTEPLGEDADPFHASADASRAMRGGSLSGAFTALRKRHAHRVERENGVSEPAQEEIATILEGPAVIVQAMNALTPHLPEAERHHLIMRMVYAAAEFGMVRKHGFWDELSRVSDDWAAAVQAKREQWEQMPEMDMGLTDGRPAVKSRLR